MHIQVEDILEPVILKSSFRNIVYIYIYRGPASKIKQLAMNLERTCVSMNFFACT